METLIIAILAAATLAEFIALVIAYRRIRGYEEGGTFTPGKDCLRITFYYLFPNEITNDESTDLQNAEKLTADIPIEAFQELLSEGTGYKKIKTMMPPPAGKVLISFDITLIPNCNAGKRQ